MRPLEASEICTGLWMGSAPPPGRSLSACGFHVLVLSAIEYQIGADNFPGVEVARISLCDDGTPLPAPDFQRAIFLATHLAHAIRRGKKVLVTCLQGRNR